MKGNNTIPIGGELESVATGGVVVSADGVRDYQLNKMQEDINEQVYSIQNSPEQNGGIGDGTHDDTSALVDALSLSRDLSIKKTYLITESISVESNISGGGTIKWGASATLNVVEDNITIRNVEFNCNNQSVVKALYLNKVKNVVIEDCSFKNCGSASTDATAVRGFILVDSCDCITIRNCSFDGCNAKNNNTSYSAFGIQIQDSTNIVIDNCTFKNILSTGSGDGDAIKVLDSTYAKEAFVAVSNCTFETFSKRALKFQSRYCSSVNNHFIVSQHAYVVIDFQAGYGLSLGDSVELDYDGTSTLPNSRLFESIVSIIDGYTDVTGMQVVCTNGQSTTRQTFVSLIESVDGTDKNIDNVMISDCDVVGPTDFIKVGTGCVCNSINVDNVVWDSGTSGTFYGIYTADATATFNNVTFNVNFTKSGATSLCPYACTCINSDFNIRCPQALFGTFFITNAATIKADVRFSSNSTFFGYNLENGKMVVNQKGTTDPSGKSTSAYGLLRTTFDKIVVLNNTFTVDTTNNVVKLGYVLTSAGTSSASGTYKALTINYIA
jgi:hypothetical protein